MSFLNELKRRNVFRVSAAYIVIAWLVIQVVETVFPAFGFGDEAVRNVTIAFIVGLIPVLVLSWVFEWTPEGLKRDAEVDTKSAGALKVDKRLDRIILVVLALALGYFAFDKYVLAPQRDALEQKRQAEALAIATEDARQEGRSEALVESYGDKSIAVLPFRDMSPEGDQEYFSDGIAEELLNLLARVPELRVTSRTSSFAFKGQSLEVPEIARRLKVGHVLEGSVRKAGDQIRITAQLIEARSDTHLWSESWDRELRDVFVIQDEIARSVVESLQTVLLGGIQTVLPGQMSDTLPRAYELVLRGRHLLNQQDRKVLDQAQQFYEQATEVAPGYAPAWGGLARTLKAQLDWKQLDGTDMGPQVEAALQRALELDPRDPDALATKGKMLWMTDVEAARTFFRDSLSVNPNDSDAYRWLGLSYMSSDPVRYLDNIRKAYLVDPTNMLTNLNMVRAYNRFGRFQEAMAVARDYHLLDPGAWQPYQMAGVILRYRGQLDEAMKAFYHLYRLHPDVLDYYDNFLWMLVEHQLNPELTEAWLEEWKRRAGELYLKPGRGIGVETAYYLLRGEGERAVGILDAARKKTAMSKWAVAYMTLRAVESYARARELYEQQFGAETLSHFDPNVAVWSIYIDYVLILQKMGERERATRLAAEISAFLEKERQTGSVFDAGLIPLLVRSAELKAVSGSAREAIADLRQAAAAKLILCLPCLRIFPHYETLRGKPDFESLLKELDAEHAATVEQLKTNGLLMRPGEVMEHEAQAFDLFANP